MATMIKRRHIRTFLPYDLVSILKSSTKFHTITPLNVPQLINWIFRVYMEGYRKLVTYIGHLQTALCKVFTSYHKSERQMDFCADQEFIYIVKSKTIIVTSYERNVKYNKYNNTTHSMRRV